MAPPGAPPGVGIVGGAPKLLSMPALISRSNYGRGKTEHQQMKLKKYQVLRVRRCCSTTKTFDEKRIPYDMCALHSSNHPNYSVNLTYLLSCLSTVRGGAHSENLQLIISALSLYDFCESMGLSPLCLGVRCTTHDESTVANRHNGASQRFVLLQHTVAVLETCLLPRKIGAPPISYHPVRREY